MSTTSVNLTIPHLRARALDERWVVHEGVIIHDARTQPPALLLEAPQVLGHPLQALDHVVDRVATVVYRLAADDRVVELPVVLAIGIVVFRVLVLLVSVGVGVGLRVRVADWDRRRSAGVGDGEKITSVMLGPPSSRRAATLRGALGPVSVDLCAD